MKIAKITTLYKDYINSFYAQRPQLKQNSYHHQLNALNNDAFGWADFWSHAMQPLGYQFLEINSNVESLQKTWLKEKNLPCPKNWILEIPILQILEFKPDLLFIDDYTTFSASWISIIKERCKSIRGVIGWCGAPYKNERIFQNYNIILSCIPEFVQRFKDGGYLAYHLDHAFDARINSRLSEGRDKINKVLFTGQLITAAGYHKTRRELLFWLLDHVDIDLYSPSKTSYKKNIYFYILNLLGVTSERKVDQRLSSRLNMPIYGLKMFQYLKDYLVCLNCHIDVSVSSASNMRLFEATGVGSCLLTDNKNNISALFEPDFEILTYKNKEECLEKLKYILQHPESATAVAAAGAKRTLRDHTFDKRAQVLDSIIKDNF